MIIEFLLTVSGAERARIISFAVLHFYNQRAVFVSLAFYQRDNRIKDTY